MTAIDPTTLDHESFLDAVDALLQRHYGIELSDTSLTSETVARLREQVPGFTPREMVHEWVDDKELDRIDAGWGFRDRLTDDHEQAAVTDALAKRH